MSDTFITADEHYDHDFIRRVKARPFHSTYEMQEAMIDRHNKRVPDSKNFLTIHAGDMFWRTLTEVEALAILSRLHGRHALVWGNHDDVIQESGWLQGAFEWVRDIHQLYFNKHKLTICHYAMRVWPKSHQGGWHVYGHSHQELPPLGKSFDIGVEGHDYAPWSLEEIAAKMERLDAHHIIPADKVWPEDASVAQTEEQVSCKDEVGGSTPPAGSTVHISGCRCGWCIAGWTRPTVDDAFDQSVALNHNLLERMGDA